MITPNENYSGMQGTPEFSTIEDFRQSVVEGLITDDDGVGYYANAEKISSVKVVLSDAFEPEEPPKDEHGNYLPPTRVRNRMAGGTHVAWYPK